MSAVSSHFRWICQLGGIDLLLTSAALHYSSTASDSAELYLPLTEEISGIVEEQINNGVVVQQIEKVDGSDIVTPMFSGVVAKMTVYEGTKAVSIRFDCTSPLSTTGVSIHTGGLALYKSEMYESLVYRFMPGVFPLPGDLIHDEITGVDHLVKGTTIHMTATATSISYFCETICNYG